MKPTSTDTIFAPLIKQLTALFRQRLDISILTIGGVAARSASALLFWVIFALLAFFVLLFLNIALAFYLAVWSDGSPAMGFFYLSAIYAGLLLLLLLVRPWLLRIVRNAVARKTIRQAKQINQRLDLIPHFRQQRYQSALRSIQDGGSYVLLEQARYQTLLLQDKTWPELVHTLSYINKHRGVIISSYVRDEALSKAAGLPLIGGFVQRFGYSPRPERPTRGKKEAESASSWFVKYSPALLLVWEVLRPSLTAMALGKAQGLFASLFSRKKRSRR